MADIQAIHRTFKYVDGSIVASVQTVHFTRQSSKDDYATYLLGELAKPTTVVEDVYVGEDVVIGRFEW